MSSTDSSPASGTNVQSHSDLMTVEEARTQILAAVQPVGTQAIALPEARGRVLAEAVVSPVDAPRFDQSAMDGYAVRWADIAGLEPSGEGVSLPMAFVIAAGDSGREALPEGAAARIMTGAPVPRGADTVVMREDTEELGEIVRVLSAPKQGAGAHIRSRGSYFSEGADLVSRGRVLDPGAIGLLASVGRVMLSVYRRPRVGIVSTGDELVPLGATPGPGQIVNSSAHMLAALVASAGCEPLVMPIARDTFEESRACFDQALASADMVVSIGGVSVGDYDVVRQVIDSYGNGGGDEDESDGMRFWKVKMKPGKPLAFGSVNDVPLIGLPGNPVSSYVCFYQFVWPALQKMAGRGGPWALPRERVRLGQALRSTPWRADYQRGSLRHDEAGLTFVPFGDQGSGNLASVVAPDALGVVPEGVKHMEVGETIVIERLPGGLG